MVLRRSEIRHMQFVVAGLDAEKITRVENK